LQQVDGAWTYLEDSLTSPNQSMDVQNITVDIDFSKVKQ
jgi:hypothetical protein